MPRCESDEPLYKAFSQFAQHCLLQDQSLLWPDLSLWTLKNLEELKERFIDQPDFSNKSFPEKLEGQLENAPPALWGIVADLYYIYCLPSASLKFKTKQKYIFDAAQKAQLYSRLPSNDMQIWKPLQKGFVHTGIKYHFKFAQFTLLILLAIILKQRPNPEAILQDHKRLREILDEILESIENKMERAYDIRHAILYLAFPEFYENCIGTQDKRTILTHYKDLIDGSLPEDMDEALFKVRQALAPEHDQDGIPFHFYRELKKEWRGEAISAIQETSGDDTYSVREWPEGVPEIEDVLRIRQALSHTSNVILYGPPGTGKTFFAGKAAESIIKHQLEQPLPETSVLQEVVERVPFYDMLALSMYVNGAKRHYSVAELRAQKLVQARFQLRPIANQPQSIWGNLQTHTSPESSTVKIQLDRRSEPFLFDKDDQSCWHLTSDGREYVEEILSEELLEMTGDKGIGTQSQDFITWVTFHQSYAYEDFVEGWRPNPDENAQNPYALVPGKFKRICARAKQDPDNTYVLIIDEINRGNISKIFGELITLIEDDKRSTTTLELSYSSENERFMVPENLIIIGTMNTADRSIALLDVALRRRFAFVELMPSSKVLAGVVVEAGENEVALDSLLEQINEGISNTLDRDHQIGHSYFLKIASVEDTSERLSKLEFVWNYQIMPLLNEYFYSRRDQLAELLSAFKPGTEDEEGDLLLGYAEGEDLVFALSKLANNI